MVCQGIQKCEFCCRALKCSDIDLIEAYKTLVAALESLAEARRGDVALRENIHTYLDMVSSARRRVAELKG